MALSTAFRTAVKQLVSTATGITMTVDGERTGPSQDGDTIAVWTSASTANEANTQFRVYAVTARIFVEWDRQVGPDEDDPLDRMEQLEEAVLSAVTPILGGARVAVVDSVFDPDSQSMDIVFMGEVLNPASEV